MPTSPLETAALDFANTIRLKLHLDPLDALRPGRRNDPAASPLAQTIGDVIIHPNYITIMDPPRSYDIPVLVRDFAHNFDLGRYEHLELPDQQTPPTYPECEKAEAVQPLTQAIGEFLDWLASGDAYTDVLGPCSVTLRHHVILAKHSPESIRRYDDIDGVPPDRLYASDYRSQRFTYDVERLLAKFYDIDLDKIEAEKRAILHALKTKKESPSCPTPTSK